MSRILINKLPVWKGQSHPDVKFGPDIMESIIRASNLKNNLNFKTNKNIISTNTTESTLNTIDNKSLQSYIYTNGKYILDLYRNDDLLINLGGDHSIAMGTILFMLTKYPTLKVIWIDAHADINTIESSKSGNWHGMPLYFLTELAGNKYNTFKKLKLSNLYYYGIRDLDKYETDLINDKEIKNFSASEILQKDRTQDIIEWVGDDPVHLSLDVDGLDPSIFPCTGTRSSNGLKLDNVINLIGEIKKKKLISMDMVEFNPKLGNLGDLEKSTNTLKKIFDVLI